MHPAFKILPIDELMISLSANSILR